MAQPQLVQIKLSRFDAQPWGFRLQGGVDFASPLLVQKVNGGSLAENAGLLPGDAVIKINDVDVYNMRHKDAQDIVVRSGNNFVITVQRGGSTWRPHVAPTGAVPQPNQNSPYLQTVTKTSLAHKQQDSQHIGCGYNNAARPFTNGSGDGNVKSIVNKQYNTPVGIYSDESIAETLSAQAEVLAGGVLGVNFKKNEKEYQADKSEVLKFLREEETGHTTPAFGHSQHYQDPSQEQHYQQQPQQQQQQQQQVYHHPIHQQQQQHHQQHQQQQSATRHVNAPINTPKPPSTGGLPTGQNICTECERLITGVFVRIKDKNLHVECFKCATCGTSLKNQGYYNFNNKLYCEIHAKLAAQQNPPAGTEGYVPVPIKPNTKLSANTISSALSSHGYNGVSNGNAVSSHAPEEQFDNTDLPLPPPPSPTQLLQLETGSMYSNNHTYTHSVVDGIEAASPVLGINSHKNYHLSASSNKSGSTSTCSTLSLDGSTLQQSISPIHSPQSGYVVNNSIAAGAALGFNGDNLISTTTNTLQTPPPPPPPPPLPLSLPTNNNYNTIFNENKENKQNTYNRTPLVKNAYNQLLKEYSNKMQTQSNYNGNGYNNNKNMTPKPFRAQSQLQSKSVGNPSNFDNLNNLSNSSSQAIVPSPSASVVNTLNSVENNQSIDLQKSATVASSMPYSIASNVSDEQTNSNNSINVNNNDYDNGSGSGTDRAQDQPFRYVTLTGNVIRSVMPPGKGTNINYKVNQGYARPFGAPASAPKSPVSFPPQPQQQWGASQPAAPRPAAGNSYATLPRSSIGQSQEPCVKTNLKPVAHNTIASNNNTNTLTYTPTDTATTMLEESLSKIKMGDKMKDFMAASGQVISNMLEARLANQQVQQQPLSSPSHSSSSLSVRSNSSSNLSRSPLQMRKRYDLNGFGNLDHIEPAALKPALKNAFTTSTLTPVDNTPHALGKVLDICDNNVALPTKSNGKDLSPLSPLPLPLPPSETVIYRNNVTQPQSDRRSTHARDRRSYIESGATQNGNQADAPAFSISVKALGRKSANGEEPLPLSPENEELVSELIKDGKQPICCQCNNVIEKGPFITALGRIWCPEHFICVNANCRRPLQDIGFVEEKGDLYCEYCFEKYLAPSCSKCNSKIKGDCLNAIGRHFHPECFTCAHCGKIFGNTPFFLEDGNPYCEADWNELFTTKCFACGFPVEAGDRWVEALNHNYHSQCFNCTYCKQNLEGQSFYNKGGRPFCKNHAR